MAQQDGTFFFQSLKCSLNGGFYVAKCQGETLKTVAYTIVFFTWCTEALELHFSLFRVFEFFSRSVLSYIEICTLVCFEHIFKMYDFPMRSDR